MSLPKSWEQPYRLVYPTKRRLSPRWTTNEQHRDLWFWASAWLPEARTWGLCVLGGIMEAQGITDADIFDFVSIIVEDKGVAAGSTILHVSPGSDPRTYRLQKDFDGWVRKEAGRQGAIWLQRDSMTTAANGHYLIFDSLPSSTNTSEVTSPSPLIRIRNSSPTSARATNVVVSLGTFRERKIDEMGVNGLENKSLTYFHLHIAIWPKLMVQAKSIISDRSLADWVVNNINNPANGIVMRADMHDLFDNAQIAYKPSVRSSPDFPEWGNRAQHRKTRQVLLESAETPFRTSPDLPGLF
ncbi:hypothetical protein GGX14DRAFT_398241 [Mycena pura]|uniref:HNH nuclease domain-containing protein n=1 Tax=Mycena pura TaxID=153505 RepID=A0AAD6V7J0_9AGAR|nr:hypothetical protein GGX14DRAFT_398241 [Mycena pura]